MENKVESEMMRLPTPTEWESYLPIHVNLFGCLSFETEDGSVSRQLNHSKKLTSLFAYLLLHPGRNIPVNELIDVLWPESGSNDPAHALKTLLYRIRCMMKEDGIPFYRECILVQSSTCRWNPQIQTVLDVNEFERCCQSALLETTPASEKLTLLSRAIGLYRGEFLPKCGAEEWIIPIAAYYHELYLKAVIALAWQLDAVRQYEEMANLCRKALLVEPYDEELHYCLIYALAKQSRKQAALEHYHYTSNLLLNRLGVSPSERMRALYHKITSAGEQAFTDMDSIQNSLQEPENAKGAFLCDYAFFHQIYQLQSRLVERNGVTMHLVLLTLMDTEQNPLPQKKQSIAMEQLLKICCSCLRKNDVISQYSSSQFVLMLPTSDEASTHSAVSRLLSQFHRAYPKSPAVIQYAVRPLTAKAPHSFSLPDNSI